MGGVLRYGAEMNTWPRDEPGLAACQSGGQSKAELSTCPCDSPGLEALRRGRAVDFPCSVN